jgi:hypothetical protein
LGSDGVCAVEADGFEGVAGGRAGRLIRTVSRDSSLAPGGFAAGGGKVMRTVSFLGSFESAMKKIGKSILKIARKYPTCHWLT